LAQVSKFQASVALHFLVVEPWRSIGVGVMAAASMAAAVAAGAVAYTCMDQNSFICYAVPLLSLFAAISMVSKKGNTEATMAEAAETASVPYDFIIVGGGTAGCVLANRLTAGTKKRVLVLEAGRSDYDSKLVRIPAGILRLFKSVYDWNFTTVNETATSGRGIFLARGKMLGGSSNLNVLLYNRGNAEDYDRWETEFRCKGWNSSDVLPHFLRSEDDQIGFHKTDPKHHASGGDWSVDHVRYQNPLSKTFLEACGQAGYKANDDFNRWDRSQEGYGRFAVSQRNGTRCDAATAMLEPALADSKRDLKVLTGTLVKQIIFDDKTQTTGVKFSVKGFDHVARLNAGGEVVLSAGAIQSPQVLMLSGIGPKAHLKEHGIQVVADLPGVGENLQDHPAAVVSYECPASQKGISVTSKLKISGTAIPDPRPMLQWLFTKSGPLTSTGCDHGGFFRTPAAVGKSPDLQMRFLAARAVTADGMGTFTAFKKTTNHPDGFSLQSIATRPMSRGRVLLTSADAAKKPAIEGNYLTNKHDVATLREGLKMARQIAQQPAFKDYLSHEVFPGAHVKTDAELDAYIADSVHTANALVGTCRMGEVTDPQTVCDASMRVKGVKGLRICDASVAPALPGGQSGACVVMIAERAADMMLGRQK